MDVEEKTVTGMADIMNFPKRWEDFLHDYEFEDARRIYTNGSRLIPSFRVKQMMEHYAQVRHGRWLDRPKNQGLKDEEIGTVGMVAGEPWSSCYCSECGEWLVASDEYAVKGNYCPNCGAKMDGGED